MVEVSAFGILTPIALAGLLLIIPILLLYLLKPKPKHVMFPSVMFIEIINRTHKLRSFLERIVKDPLLLVQIIMICLLTFALAGPYVSLLDTGRGVENVVIVVDASASMKADDVKPTRFDESIRQAIELVGNLNSESTISVVLASQIPTTVLVKSSPENAIAILETLEAGDSPLSIAQAVKSAIDLKIEKQKNSVFVFSDFAGSLIGLEASASVLASTGFEVEWIKVSSDIGNVGIVDFAVEQNRLNKSVYLSISVENSDFDTGEAVVSLHRWGEQISSMRKNIDRTAFFEFMIPGVEKDLELEVKVSPGGALKIDDEANIIVPSIETQNILLLSVKDDPEIDKYLKLMLQSIPNTHLTIEQPPVIPEFDMFDIIVLGNVEASSILPGTFRDISKKVEEGGAFIAVSNSETWKISNQNFWNIIPVKNFDYDIKTIPIESGEHPVLKDIVFDNVVVDRYFKSSLKEKSHEIVKSGDYPLVSINRIDEGFVVFMGINPEPSWSNFRFSSSYPILWSKLFDYFRNNGEGVKNMNYRTGDVLPISANTEVITPTGDKISTQSIVLDEVGFYKIGNEIYGVSLADEIESNITSADISFLKDSVSQVDLSETIESKIDLYPIILLFAFIMIVFDVLLYMRRGIA